MIELLFLLTSICLSFPLFVGALLWLSTRKYAHLPGDLGSPVVGNLRRVLNTFINATSSDLYDRVTHLMDVYGNTICMWFGPVVSIATSDPDIVQVLYRHPAAMNKEPLIYDKMKDEISRGLFSTSITGGPEWKKYKEGYNISLKKSKLETYHQIFVKRSLELVSALKEQTGEFDVNKFVVLMAIDTILETHFGISFDELKNRNFNLFSDITVSKHRFIQMMSNPMTYFRPARFQSIGKKGLELFHKKCLDEIRMNIMKYGNNPANTDEYCLAEWLAINGLMKGQSLESIDVELREVIYVGSFTTSELISATLLFLAMDTDVQKNAWKEQEEIFCNSSRAPSIEDIKRMPYLDRVLREATRMIAPPITSRRLKEEILIGDLRLPKNSTILIFIRRILMNPKYFENSEKFDPDHFLPQNAANRPECLSLFGLAPRICPGSVYGLNQSKVVISLILRNFILYSTRKPEDIKYRPGIMMEIEGPYNILLEHRH